MLTQETQAEIMREATNAAVKQLITADLPEVTLLTLEQVAALWGVSTLTVNRSDLKRVHLGKSCRFRLSDVRRFLEGRVK